MVSNPTRDQRDRYNLRSKEISAAKAIAAGRIPGRVGQPSKNRTPEELREMRRLKTAKWRAANPERYREIIRRSMKKTNDAKAVAAGRVPGQLGTPVRTPIEVQRKKRAGRTMRYYYEDIEKGRALGATNARNRRARIKQVGGTHTAADVSYLRALQKDKCAFCLLSLGDQTPDVDHYVPLALGGTNERSNLRILHATCNRMKSAKHPAEFGLQHGLLCW